MNRKLYILFLKAMNRIIYYEVDLDQYDIIQHETQPFQSSNVLDVTSKYRVHVIDAKQVSDPNFIVHDGAHYYTYVKVSPRMSKL